MRSDPTFFILFLSNLDYIFVMNTYQDLFLRYLNHSNEKQKVIEQVLHYLPKTAEKLSILDVGSGTGIISNALAKEGHKITAIDIQNAFMVPAPSENQPTFFQTDIFHFQTNQKFDIIIASYLFWEIPFDQWDRLFDRFFSLLKSEGKIFIIDTLNDTPYDNTFIESDIYSEMPKDREKLKNYWYQYLNEKKYLYEKHPFKTELKADSPEKMYEVIEFFFQQKKFRKIYEQKKELFLKDFEKKRINEAIVLSFSHSLDVIYGKV